MTDFFTIPGESDMPKTFKRGDHVAWNSEAGRVRGIILRKVTSNIQFKGYVHHASKDEPQYFIQSDRTDHLAIHRGQVLRLLMPQKANRNKKDKKEKGRHRRR